MSEQQQPEQRIVPPVVEATQEYRFDIDWDDDDALDAIKNGVTPA